MPVPKAVEQAPRKLLRDVVFDQMLAAIQDGTLQPGERLNDEELEQWLGVSRTPIREAISKLAEIGLVETAPQRYTRVANPTLDEHWQALRMLNGFHELSARWSIPHFTDEDVEQFRALGEDLLSAIADQDPRAFGATAAFREFMVARADNVLLQTMARQLSARVAILAATGVGSFQADIFTAYVNGLVAAAEHRDAAAAERVMREQAAVTDEYMASLIAAAAKD